MNTTRILVPAALALLFPLASPAADPADAISNRGYAVDSNRNVVRSGAGVCVRTGEWTPALAAAAAACRECSPELCPVRAAATPPPPMAAAQPEPPPAPAAAPAPEPRRLSFATDTLFDFDKAELKPEGKSLLDALARDIASIDYDAITISGHADRIGDAAYNKKLSERRANAVREYLLSKNQSGEGAVAGFAGGSMLIDPGRIEAVGLGEEQPVTRADECAGNRATRQLIACLQPDRRVEIEVHGTEQPAGQQPPAGR